ncbi:MAG: chloride channel protein [Candidatus Dadabacteria bacterium]|nr:chloride channel protein [Candidatus Dadabacteria bacterium]
MSRNYTRVFVACGVSGAIAATFNAPIAAVLFAEEIALIRNFKIGSFLPIVIASAVGTITSRALRGNSPLFTVPPYQFTNYLELVFYAVFGLLIGVLSFLFIKLFYRVNDIFSNLNLSQRQKPILGGILVGVIALIFPYILGNGYEHADLALKGELSVLIILGLIILKPLATAITLGSGWPGGVFAPSILIGASLGSGFGLVVGYLLSSATPLGSAYSTVGMGTFLAAVTQAPLTSIFLIFEMTANYQVVIPIMISSVLASAVSRFLAGGSLESIELKRMGIDIEEGHERQLLRSIRVEDVMIHDIETIPENTTLRSVIEDIPNSRHTTFPIVDDMGLLTGIISIQDFREWIFEESLKDIVVVKELATMNVITVTPDDTLDVVLDKWGKKPVEILPVIDSSYPRKMVGILSRRDVIGAYNKALSEKFLEEKD